MITRNGETNLKTILKTLKPLHNKGEFVFCLMDRLNEVNMDDVVFVFREKEGFTVVLERKVADAYKLSYSFVASWITLSVHSSLEAVGLTTAFSTVLSAAGISCNVVAAFFHDHIFVSVKDLNKTMQVLKELSNEN